jgi:hypothetical protein
MRRTILFAASMMVWTFASSQVLTLADVKAKNAVQLNAADLKQLLPGSKVVNHNPSGATRRWENSLSGDLSASSDGRGNTGGHAMPGSGSGSWKIDDKGTYCVQIKWNWMGRSEDWCRYIFKAGDIYYAFNTLQDTAQANEFEISK